MHRNALASNIEVVGMLGLLHNIGNIEPTQSWRSMTLDVLRSIRQFAYITSSNQFILSELLRRCLNHSIAVRDSDLQNVVRSVEKYVRHNLKYREAISSEARNMDLELEHMPIDQRACAQICSENSRSCALWFNDDTKTYATAAAMKAYN